MAHARAACYCPDAIIIMRNSLQNLDYQNDVEVDWRYEVCNHQKKTSTTMQFQLTIFAEIPETFDATKSPCCSQLRQDQDGLTPGVVGVRQGRQATDFTKEKRTSSRTTSLLLRKVPITTSRQRRFFLSREVESLAGERLYSPFAVRLTSAVY